MSATSEKIKRARQIRVLVGDKTIIARRPTNLEMIEMKGKFNQRYLLENFVEGWDGFKESDLFPGGTEELVPFDRETYCEYIADNPQHWIALTNAIVDGYAEYEAKLEESLKN